MPKQEGALQTSALWRLLTQHPEVLGRHAMAYALLVQEQLGLSLQRAQRAVLRGVLLLLCVGVTWVCASVALMLWAISPAQPPAVLAVLVGLVLLPLLVALGLWLVPSASKGPSLLEILQEQLQADWELLHRATP